MHDLRVQKLLGGVGELAREVASEEAVARIPVGALDEGIRVPESDTERLEVNNEDFVENSTYTCLMLFHEKLDLPENGTAEALATHDNRSL